MESRVRDMWTGLAGVPAAFGGDVVVSPGSRMCPPGWAGVVVIGDAGLVTAPSAEAADLMRGALAAVPVGRWTAPEALRARLPIAEALGPATLAYTSSAPPVPADRVERGDPAALIASVPAEDADEAELPSPAFVLRSDGRVVAGAGYHEWPGRVAHLSVLTAPSHRGRGLARTVAAAAVADAVAAGLLAQWRARPEASRRVARALGFTELGAQLSLRLAGSPPPAPP